MPIETVVCPECGSEYTIHVIAADAQDPDELDDELVDDDGPE